MGASSSNHMYQLLTPFCWRISYSLWIHMERDRNSRTWPEPVAKRTSTSCNVVTLEVIKIGKLWVSAGPVTGKKPSSLCSGTLQNFPTSAEEWQGCFLNDLQSNPPTDNFRHTCQLPPSSEDAHESSLSERWEDLDTPDQVLRDVTAGYWNWESESSNEQDFKNVSPHCWTLRFLRKYNLLKMFQNFLHIHQKFACPWF